MLKEFDELEKLVTMPFYNDAQYLFNEYRAYVVANNLTPSGYSLETLSNDQVRNYYFTDKIKKAESNVLAYIESIVSDSVSDRNKLINNIEIIYRILGELRSQFHHYEQVYWGMRKAEPDSENLWSVLFIYGQVDKLLTDLFNKVKSRFGHLVSEELHKKYSSDPLSMTVNDMAKTAFKNQRDEEFNEYVKNISAEIYKQPSPYLAMLFINDAIANNRQLQLNGTHRINSGEGGWMDTYFFAYCQKRIDWLKIEFEKIENDEKIIAKDASSQKSQNSNVLTKLKTTLTLRQIALLYNLLTEGKVIEGTQVDFRNFIAKSFSTKRQEDISANSLENKFYEVDDKDREKVQSILYKIAGSNLLKPTVTIKKK